MREKIKIINIMNHPPAYEEYADKPKPPVHWNLKNGNWVGIWGYDWADILGENLLKFSERFEYEVWQPDYRADSIYSHMFETGLIHRLFPAKKIRFFRGFYLAEGLISQSMEKSLLDLYQKERTILILNAHFGYLENLLLNLIKDKFPYLFLMYHNPKIFFGDSVFHRNPLKYLHRKIFYFYQYNYLKNGKYLVTSTTFNTEFLEKQFKLKVFPIAWGIDFEKWDIKLSKNDARESLCIDQNKLVFFSFSRLVEVKQIDKFLYILSKFKHKDFLYIVAGHGKSEYEKYLKDLVYKFELSEKVKFVGYLNTFNISKYLIAADIFVSPSYLEGGPMAAFEAMLFSKPMIITNVGLASEFLQMHNCGYIISNTPDNSWTEALEKVFNGNFPKILDKKIVQNFLNWKDKVKEWEKVFEEVLTQYK